MDTNSQSLVRCFDEMEEKLCIPRIQSFLRGCKRLVTAILLCTNKIVNILKLSSSTSIFSLILTLTGDSSRDCVALVL